MSRSGEKRNHGSCSNGYFYQEPVSHDQTVTAPMSHANVIAISEFISQLDETVAMRLQRMQQRLAELEMQMDFLEAEICKTSYIPYMEMSHFPSALINGFQA